MEDKTTIGNNENANTPSEAFREYIESLVEEIVINNAVFNEHKKYLQRYSQEEGVDYTTLEKNLTEFFETLEELKSHGSKSSERLAKMLANNCYLKEGKVEKLIDSMNRQQQEDSNNLAALDDLKQQLQNYLDKPKSQTPPTVTHVNSNWATIFIEQICQAYCNKNIEFLEDAFSQNAQIITGAFEKNQTNIRYRTQGKKQYFANLKYIFQRNKTIDVKFETDNSTGIFYSSADGKCLGYRLLQRWRSDNYSDSGYLYLALYAGQNGPKVMVRVWSPK